MSAFDLSHFFLDILADESRHFLLSLLLGSLGFSWMWTTLFAALSGVAFLTRRRPSMVVVYGILICCSLVGVSFALAGHWALDYWSTLWLTPLGPPLELRLQN